MHLAVDSFIKSMVHALRSGQGEAGNGWNDGTGELGGSILVAPFSRSLVTGGSQFEVVLTARLSMGRVLDIHLLVQATVA